MPQRIIILILTLLCSRIYAAQAMPLPENTEIIHYIPTVPAKAVEGNCWTSSIAAYYSPYAWRCMTTESIIYDPCLTAADGATIVCGVPDEEFVMRLNEPLPEHDKTDVEPRPWRIDLTDGVVCTVFTGTLPPIQETALYGCSDGDNSVLLEDLQQNDGLWQARKVLIERNENAKEDEPPFHITQETLVPILKVWFAGDPAEAAR